ncbi:MAG: DUF4097 family beta strand repeat protein [Clostridia bacterium]|nr:DUF4097 family beta strand repeat protein [Clostridia bacterium]
MKKASKILITIALSLIVIGMIIFIIAGFALRWDFSKFGAGKFVTNTLEISEEFTNLSVKTDTADIEFLPSENEKCKVVCYRREKQKYYATVENNALIISSVDESKWYELIFNVGSPKITVYLPNTQYSQLVIKQSTGDVKIPNNFKFDSIDLSVTTGDVYIESSVNNQIKINSSTGDVKLENLTANSINVSLSTGDVNVSNVTLGGDISIGVSTGKVRLNTVSCVNLSSTGDTGDIYLNSVIASQKFDIQRSTGDVKFSLSDASEIFVETDTGDVSGTLLTSKIFIVSTDTGDINVPSSTSGGRCEITTDTGDIKIQIAS